ncbi:MAG: AI-2E family transporter [Pseudomonadota bacterium]
MRATVTVAAFTWLLITAEGVLRPFATALLLALILSASSERLVRLVPSRWRRGKTVARLVSVLGIGAIVLGVALLVVEAVGQLRANVDVYAANLNFLLSEVQSRTGSEQEITVIGLVRQMDLRAMALGFAASTAAFGSVFFVVVLYVVFIFSEARVFKSKLSALANSPADEAHLHSIARDIKRGIDDVLGVQVLVGILQAVPTFIVLTLVGVDAAVLWAVLVFFFSFIPTIGTAFGIAVPSLMTLLQFMTLQPFLIVLILTGAVQLYGTNILLPRLMSRSLNVSSLAVLFAVFAGGALWGIIGAIIAVPVLTIALIVCAKIKRLRPVAVLISADGSLPGDGNSSATVSAAESASGPTEP